MFNVGPEVRRYVCVRNVNQYNVDCSFATYIHFKFVGLGMNGYREQRISDLYAERR